jgi:hypothetical protein
MATSKGKNTATTGINNVPKPKPENKVSKEATSATIETTTISIKTPDKFSS